MQQQHHHTRLAAGKRRAVTPMHGRRPVTRVLLALAVVVLLAGAVVARPVAAGDTPACPSGSNAIPGNDSDQVVGTFDVSPVDGAGDVTVTLIAFELLNPNYRSPLITATLSGPAGPGGATVASTVGGLETATISKTFSTATSVKVIVGGPSGADIQWAIHSEGGGCIKGF